MRLQRRGRSALQLTLPFVQNWQSPASAMVVIRVGTFKRHVPLPRVLTRLKTGC